MLPYRSRCAAAHTILPRALLKKPLKYWFRRMGLQLPEVHMPDPKTFGPSLDGVQSQAGRVDDHSAVTELIFSHAAIPPTIRKAAALLLKKSSRRFVRSLHFHIIFRSKHPLTPLLYENFHSCGAHKTNSAVPLYFKSIFMVKPRC